MNYRREIDGLRALALLPVILFHAGIQTFRGGFVGVDVFFVISGYLITSIILAEQQTGTFSLMSFYERRARRILPALFVVVFACVLFAWLWMLPGEMKAFAKSVVAVSTFTSNLFFWTESGYFAPTSQLRPLLHTWSLAVEEQYYLLFPLFLLLTWRMGKRWVVSLLIVGGVISLAWAQWGAFHMPGATFYLLPTRGWELMFGVLVAFYLFDKGNHKRTAQTVDQLASLIGILLIIYAVFAFDEQTPFPSFYALVPTLGTALVILFAREQTIVGRLLSSRVLVGVGLISYSAYLWHYPLFVFARFRSIDEPSQTMLLALAFTAMLFAYVSWNYVEQPIRSRHLFERSTVFVTTAIGSGVLLLIGWAGYITNGFPARWDSNVLIVASNTEDHWRQLKAGGCNLEDSDFTLKRCVRGISTQPPLHAIWGDSHAAAIVLELEKSFNERGLSFLQYTKYNCPVSLDLHIQSYKAQDHNCDLFTKSVMRDLADKKIHTVILVSRWDWYVEGIGFDNGEGGAERQSVRVSTNEKDLYTQVPTDQEKVLASYIDTILSLLRDLQQVILVYPVPTNGWDVPKRLMKLLMFNNFEPVALSTDYSRVSQRLSKVNEAFDGIGEHPNLIRIKPDEIFCDTYINSRCVAHLNGAPLYFDTDHLSDAGARLVVDAIMKQMES
jgi:peptidoglycan/LPS O-acetylase OafA/YrhL